MAISSSQLLNSHDFCRRQAQLSQSWEKEAISPMGLLWRGIEAGLTSTRDDPGQHAGDSVMTLATQRTIDTPRQELLQIAEHHAALADMIVWLLTESGPWKRPEPIMLGDHAWHPGSYLDPSGGLRRLVLCDHWTEGSMPDTKWLEGRAAQERWDWRTLEGAIYGLPMTLIVIVIGASRDGFRHGPLTRGWLHPRNGKLRFVKTDGTGFGGQWEPIRRERFTGSREKWLEAMTEDGVLGNHCVTHEVPAFENDGEIRAVANSKLQAIFSGVESEVQFSRCFDPVRNCPFRSLCVYGRNPDTNLGFVHLKTP